MAYVPDGEEKEGDIAVTEMYCDKCEKTTTWHGTYTRMYFIGRKTVRDGWKCSECGTRQ